MRILIVEDERGISEVIRAYVEKEGYEAKVADDGEKAVELFGSFNPDLVILDLMLPLLPGEEVCRKIRETSGIPIIMLTAKGGEDDVIKGLDVGADDYVIKPFSPRVLMARVRAHLRSTSAASSRAVLKVDDLNVDEVSREISRDGVVLPTTRNEFLVFLALASNPEKTFSRDELILTAFGSDYDGFDRTIDTYIKNLRRKLGDEKHTDGYIRTVHGFGYRISVAVQKAN